MPRPRLQFRLLTALILMVAAAILLQANLRISGETRVLDSAQLPTDFYVLFQKSYSQRGWPLPYWVNDPPSYPRVYQGTYNPNDKSLKLDDFADRTPTNFNGKWLPKGLAADIAMCVGILVLIAFLCEATFARCRDQKNWNLKLEP